METNEERLVGQAQCEAPDCPYYTGFLCGECPGWHGECLDFIPAIRRLRSDVTEEEE